MLYCDCFEFELCAFYLKVMRHSVRLLFPFKSYDVITSNAMKEFNGHNREWEIESQRQRCWLTFFEEHFGINTLRRLKK